MWRKFQLFNNNTLYYIDVAILIVLNNLSCRFSVPKVEYGTKLEQKKIKQKKKSAYAYVCKYMFA